MNDFFLLGYKTVKTKKGGTMYVLHFAFEDKEWVGDPGREVLCMQDRLEGNLELGAQYRVYDQSGSNFAVLVRKM